MDTRIRILLHPRNVYITPTLLQYGLVPPGIRSPTTGIFFPLKAYVSVCFSLERDTTVSVSGVTVSTFDFLRFLPPGGGPRSLPGPS